MRQTKWPVTSVTGQVLATAMCGPMLYDFARTLMQRAKWLGGSQAHCPHCGQQLKGHGGEARLLDLRTRGLWCSACPKEDVPT